MLVICLFFLGPAIVMAIMYRREYAAHFVIAAGVIAFIAEMLFGFIVVALMGINVNEAMTAFLIESFETVPEVMRADIPDEIIDQAIFAMTQMIPLYMFSIALFYTMMTHWIGRKFMLRAGLKAEGLPPIKEWMLPKSLVWYYVGALLLSYVINADSTSVFLMILLNLLPIMLVIFCIQAVSFLFFLADLKRWNKALPIIGIFACFLFPSILSLLGVFDVMFDLRKKLQEQK